MICKNSGVRDKLGQVRWRSCRACDMGKLDHVLVISSISDPCWDRAGKSCPSVVCRGSRWCRPDWDGYGGCSSGSGKESFTMAPFCPCFCVTLLKWAAPLDFWIDGNNLDVGFGDRPADLQFWSRVGFFQQNAGRLSLVSSSSDAQLLMTCFGVRATADATAGRDLEIVDRRTLCGSESGGPIFSSGVALHLDLLITGKFWNDNVFEVFRTCRFVWSFSRLLQGLHVSGCWKKRPAIRQISFLLVLFNENCPIRQQWQAQTVSERALGTAIDVRFVIISTIAHEEAHY